MRIFTGRPRNRMGIVFDDWVQPDPSRKHFVKRLPRKTAWEITRLFGVSIGHWSLVLQRVDAPEEQPEVDTEDRAQSAAPPS